MSRILVAVGGLTTLLILCAAANCTAAELDHMLFQLVRRGDTRLIANLLRQGTPPDVRSNDGSTPLMLAALRGSAECVALFLEHGADANPGNATGRPLHLVAVPSGPGCRCDRFGCRAE